MFRKIALFALLGLLAFLAPCETKAQPGGYCSISYSGGIGLDSISGVINGWGYSFSQVTIFDMTIQVADGTFNILSTDVKSLSPGFNDYWGYRHAVENWSTTYSGYGDASWFAVSHKGSTGYYFRYVYGVNYIGKNWSPLTTDIGTPSGVSWSPWYVIP